MSPHPSQGRRQRRALAVSERERLREAHCVARLASWEWDPSDDRIDLSSELLEFAGIELGGTPTLAQMLAFVPLPEREESRAALRSLLSGKEGEVAVECPVEVPSPEIGWVEVRARPVRGAGGRVVRLRGTVQDITARKLAELAQRQSEERLRQAQRMAGIGSFEVDYRSGKVTWSPELYRLLGIAQDTFSHELGEARRMLPPDDRERIRELSAATLQDGRPRELEHRYLRRGAVRCAEMRIEALGDERGRYGVRGTMQDVTERMRAEQEIHLQARLLDAVDAAVIATDLDQVVTHWNAGAERLYGRTRDEALGCLAADLTVGAHGGATAEAVVERLRGKAPWEGEIDVHRPDGSKVRAFVRDALFTDPDGQPAGMVAVAVDITTRVESQHRQRAARDYLRAITDSMGEGLCTVGTDGRLMYMNRAAEQLLGWQRDELAGAVMHDVTHHRRPDGTPFPIEECPLSGARRDREVLRVDDDMFVRKDGSELPVAYTSAPIETEEGVLGSVVVFRDISQRKAHELRLTKQMEAASWVARVRDALAEGRFVLHAQPIIALASGETVQHELLIRMLDHDGAIVPPGKFLPAAEQYGSIASVDRWVINQAIGLACQGHPVELNLSAHSLTAPDLVDDFRAELIRTGADPSLIVVELTETALVDAEDAAELFIERVGALGCKLALDDFGTGYGGFSYLKRLPVDYLKIDREFVSDLPTNEASQHVVKAVVSLARGFGQQTVAEGVEDHETLRMLREIGVDHAQGYVIARPRPVSEVLPQPIEDVR